MAKVVGSNPSRVIVPVCSLYNRLWEELIKEMTPFQLA